LVFVDHEASAVPDTFHQIGRQGGSNGEAYRIRSRQNFAVGEQDNIEYGMNRFVLLAGAIQVEGPRSEEKPGMCSGQSIHERRAQACEAG
jgi:hypothetical protein